LNITHTIEEERNYWTITPLCKDD